MTLQAAQSLGLIVCAAGASAGYLWSLLRGIGAKSGDQQAMSRCNTMAAASRELR
jgi:hypothetical protein